MASNDTRNSSNNTGSKTAPKEQTGSSSGHDKSTTDKSSTNKGSQDKGSHEQHVKAGQQSHKGS
ncbi:hypothetical protein HNQ50_002478 [Silvimonas terrae]|uniref:Uncharacterized protein n=1 Tax=Silvimonas terrae TaxID=300266 RepID=A0A840RGU9_9NEIS|nr:hypothetical protein [Silvimonas terrae]MBB5191748.1 hypothetical protein [Silvimonas terrae]